MLPSLLSHFSPKAALERMYTLFQDKRCPVCKNVHSEKNFLCLNCKSQIELRPDNICLNCGLELNSPDTADLRCISCQSNPFNFSRLYFYGIYNGLLRDMILNWKFYNNLGYSSVFGNFMVKLCCDIPAQSKPELIIPVPLHSSRLRLRGFNQSRILALGAASTTGAVLSDKALIRIRKTSPQTQLSGLKRRENLLEAFTADRKIISNKKVLLVDDVYTTGSTANECAGTLLKAGANKVEVMTLARALI